MTTSIHTNTSAMIALQNLNRTSDQLASTQSRVNTGLKVQGAKDNAAVWAVAQGQRADKGSLEAVTTSLNRATSIADVSLAAGEQISDILLEMKQKATAAADPSQSAATRASYDQEFQALLKSVQSFADNAIFDGANILDGAATTDMTFLASADGNETIAMKRQNLTLVGLGLAANSYDSNKATAAIDAWTDNAGTPEDETLLNAAPDLLTQEKAKFALQRIDDAITVASSRLSELGAQAKQIERHTTYVGKLSDSLEAGIGNLVDADLAKESARLQALQVQQQLGVQALSIANQAPQMILSLFKN
ncbi:flagellin [Brevundimonas sp. EAKA]|jgi:flagellin|uniref:Flagellin n=1 Tax=Brevundimonas mediterranea TaxID=74329 RepID=A0A6G7EEE8_9CAUL|nr:MULTISPECIES: flagellin [Brevundimonas]MBU4195482.1 flagellin [Alphaproteobacteria bacterium]MDZ4321313.1 flagellin [Phenylobacterium sp.]OGN48031.1 MAG: flagellin [Caulobacterales bacterium RIFCSPHIGHO2_12_FULL_68_13]OYX80896.1 MAG: flagellin [Brevundimonas sp. 32-68-21]EDX81762.1 Bacterial flagellin N-terminus domain protein [Brevundimonas sp. BAL3]